jgi:hypothetical protein
MRDDETPEAALGRLVTWEVNVALDPAVSSAAVKLKRQGGIAALTAYIETVGHESVRAEIRRRIEELEAKG